MFLFFFSDDTELRYNADFLVSGVSDIDCKEYWYCPTLTRFSQDTKWAIGQPNFAGNTEFCAQLSLKTGTGSVMNDVSCSVGYNTICEVRMYSSNGVNLLYDP